MKTTLMKNKIKLSVKKLEEILVGPGYIDKADFDVAVKMSKQANLANVLVEQSFIKDEEIGQVIATSLGYTFINLKKEKIKNDTLLKVPEIVARNRGVIAFSENKNGVNVGMTNPDDIEIKHNLGKIFGVPVKPFFITGPDFNEAMLHYKESIEKDFDTILHDLKAKSLTHEQQDQAKIKMVNSLIEHGYFGKASDIHIEPEKNHVSIRFRIDGILHDVLTLPHDFYEFVLTRIKVMAKMRIDEHMSAQDGKIQYKIGENYLDIRISIVPITNGENIVMRLLSADSRRFSLTSLGLSGNNLKKINRAIKNPHGMILVTGPTGSGKTSTLYEILKKLNTEDIHISTIEDPVEYDIEGISQIQVNNKTNLSFAQGLRAIVRQDPDIIMVGEVRDPETAGIAINSAMTGHLVLSTLHANDAVTTIPRLLDMEIEPFLISSTLNLAIAQRLVRKICEKCRVSYQATKEDKDLINTNNHLNGAFNRVRKIDIDKLTLFKGTGCKVCSGTGYRGRTGIFEILDMSDKIKREIINKSSSNQILEVAREGGMTSLLEDGIEKVLDGVTTLSEILRVTKE